MRLFRRLSLLLLLWPTVAASTGVEVQRRAFEIAHQAALQAPPGRWQILGRGLEGYPLYPYLVFAGLTRDLARVKADAVRDFIARWPDSPLANDLRLRWLHQLATRRQWQDFIAFYEGGVGDTALRCHYVAARLALGDRTRLSEDAKALWLTGRSLPDACDAAIAWLKGRPEFGEALVWERIKLAARERQVALIRHLAALLPAAAQAEAERWAATIANPGIELGKAGAWPDDMRHRELVLRAAVQLARRDSTRAAALWPVLSRKLKFDENERAEALNAIALWRAANYEPDAAQWLAQVPHSRAEDAVREWRVREALTRGDWTATLMGLDGMSEAQKRDARWRYTRARVLELLGRKDEARVLMAELAMEANFHGFLAADRLDQPYALCPQDAPATDAAKARLAAHAGLQRAFELHAIAWHPQAQREWDLALRGADAELLRAAVAQAQQDGWTDRGPLGLLKPEQQRWYAQRFPLAQVERVRAASERNGLDPAVSFSIIRAESAWNAQARSHANALGLMQLLPSVAKQVARREKLTYRAAGDLYRPEVNIPLGVAHLADELQRWNGRLWVAAAAYNAGPTPVKRWLAARPSLPADLWVETIPYRETREYVARVLAFSVIHDWRLNGDAAAMSTRIATAAGNGARRSVICPDSHASRLP